MELTIQLTAEEEIRYLEIRQTLLQNPQAIIEEFVTIWLRVVGEIGTPALEDMPRIWLLADGHHGSSRGGDRDVHNLKMAHDYGRPWDFVPFDQGYWVLDEKLADKLLAAGIKSYGTSFIYDFDIEEVDYKFQELLTGQIVHPW